MKKKILTIFFTIVMVLSLSVPALAATSTYVPSVRGSDDVKIIKSTDSNGDPVPVTLIPYDDASYKTGIMAEAYEKLSTDGVSLELPDGVVTEQLSTISFCNITIDDNVSFPLTITMDIDVRGMDYVQVIQYLDGKWLPVETTVNDDGTVTMKVDEAGPVAVVAKVSGSTSVASPQTGVKAGFVFLFAAVCLMAGAGYCFKAARRSA